VLDTFDIDKISLAPLLFQTGYLTVSERRLRGASETYILKIPNLEVREALYLNIIADFTSSDEEFAETSYLRIKDALIEGDLQRVLEILRSLFASIPYQLQVDKEAYYHSIFYAVMSVLGFDTSAEVSVAKGRIDAVLELPDKIYVVEFKYENCEHDAPQEKKQKLFKEALAEGEKQLLDKGYADKYAASGKEIIQAAFAFLGRDDIEMMVVNIGD